MSTLDSLLSSTTWAHVRATIHAAAVILKLKPEAWKAGEYELEISTAVSKVFAIWWNAWATPAIRGGHVDTAEGGWLDARGEDVKVKRILATFAVGEWTGTNTGAITLGPYAPGDLVFANAIGKTYRNADTVSFVVGVNDPIAIEAEEVGSGSDAAPGQVTLQTVVLNLSGSNAESILGRDKEEDEPYRARIKLKPASLSPNGPRGAYQYVALTPTDTDRGLWNHGVDVNRARVSPWSDDGEVNVLLAKPGGALSVDELAAVDDAIQKNVVPDRQTANVTSATNLAVPVTYTVYVRAASGVDPAKTKTYCDLAIARLFRFATLGGDKLPPADGEADPAYLFKNTIEGAIGRAAQYLDQQAAIQELVQVVVSAPAGDVLVDDDEVPISGTITGTVVRL